MSLVDLLVEHYTKLELNPLPMGLLAIFVELGSVHFSRGNWVFSSIGLLFFHLSFTVYSADDRGIGPIGMSSVVSSANMTYSSDLVAIRDGGNLHERNGGDYDAEKSDFHFEDESRQPQLVVDPQNIDPFYEGTDTTFTVKLDKEPSGDIKVSLSLSDQSHTSLDIDPVTLTFTSANWNREQEVKVSHTDNNRADGDGWVFIELTSEGGGSSTVEVHFKDEADAPNLVLMPASGINPFHEGTDTTFTVKLDKPPSDNVVVPLTVRNTNGHVHLDFNPKSLTFTPVNWDREQEVKVSHTDNDTADGEGWVAIELTPEGGGARKITRAQSFHFEDNDESDLKVNPGNQRVRSFNEGETATFTVKLDKMPSDNVVVSLTAQSSNVVPVSFNPESLMFSTETWDTEQEIKVSNEDNDTVEGNVWVYVDLEATGGGVSGTRSIVGLYFKDNEEPEVTLSASPNPVDEGKSVTFTAAISEDPIVDVVVPLTFVPLGAEPEDYGNLTTISITIPSGKRTGTVDVNTTEDDADYEDERFRLTIDGGGLLPSTVRRGSPAYVDITINDNDVDRTASEERTELPEELSVQGSYPNPFRTVAKIVYNLPEQAQVYAEVFDLLGRAVYTSQIQKVDAGWNHTLSLDLSTLSSGLYIYRINVDTASETLTRTGRMIQVQ